MILRVLDVPAKYANTHVESIQGGTSQPVTNGGPDVEPSVISGSEQAQKALRDLAERDGWAALYDPTNTDTTTISDGQITEIRDSLGNMPPLTGVATPETVGSLQGFSGELLWPELENSEIQIVAPAVTSESSYLVSSQNGSNTIFLGSNNTSLVFQESVGAEYYSANYGHALNRNVPNIVSFNVGEMSVHVGAHELTPDEELSEPLQNSEYGQLVLGAATGVTLGPIVVANNRVEQQTHHRMVSLLSALTGAANTVQQDAQLFVPSGYATVDDRGELLASFRADRPEQLASVTKVLTCFLARKLVPDNELDDLIGVAPQYVPERTTRVPVVTPGDSLSWRDAFHGSLMVSHNQITDTIAHHAGLLLNPESETPIDDFVAHMNATARDDYGWDEAVFTTPQGRYDSILTPRHTCQLLLKVADEDPWLTSVMSTTHYDYVIKWADSDNEDDTSRWTNIVRDGQSGIAYPELVGGKSGDTPAPTKRSVAILWNNPVTGRSTASCVLDTGSSSAHRWDTLRNILTASRHYHAKPDVWSSNNSSTQIAWGYNDMTPYVAITKQPGAQGFAAASPFSVYHAPLPVMRPGDTVTVRAAGRSGIPQLTARVAMQAHLQGGMWDTGTQTIQREDNYSNNSEWVTHTLSGKVTRGGVLNVVLTDTTTNRNTSFHTKDVLVTIDTPDGEVHAYDMQLMDYQTTQDTQPLDSSDLSGSVGEFQATVQAPRDWPITATYGSDWLTGKRVNLITQGTTIAGHISGVSEKNQSVLSVTGQSVLGPLNAYNVQSRPYQGTLVELFQQYMTLASERIPSLTADPALEGRTITVPGWTGELWHHIKMLCAAERVQLQVTSTGVHVEPAPTDCDMPSSIISRDDANPSSKLAQYVEVVRRNNRWVSDLLVYPHDGWDEKVSILSVNPGEYVVHTIELQTSLESFIQPAHVDYVSRLDRSRSQYTITGDDGQTVSAQEFAEAGGLIQFRVGDDRRTIEVIMQGARGLINDDRKYIRTFSLASRFGDAPYKYSTLRILGTGVMWDEKPVRFPTGVRSTQTGTEVGATIDNPFLSSMSQVVEAGVQAARKYSGFNPELTISTNVDHQTTIGGVMSDRRTNYRVLSVSDTPAVTTISGEYHFTHQNHSQLQQGTYNQVSQQNHSMIDSTYRDEIGKGKHIL